MGACRCFTFPSRLTSVAVRELSVVLPAFNEEGNLEHIVGEALALLGALALERFEVVVVDDGSTDQTSLIGDDLAARHPEVTMHHHPRNQGYGAALRTGLMQSRLAWVFWTDSDGQFDLTQLTRLLDQSDNFDAVIGYRIQRADHLGRKMNTLAWTMLIRLVLGVRVRDVDCAFKLINRRALEIIGPLQSDGAVISAELVARLNRAGMPICQVGVDHYPRTSGEPSGASLRVVARAMRELVHLRRQLAGQAPVSPEPANGSGTPPTSEHSSVDTPDG
jgi:cellulose synthase/poly-beta-1,6-N-acetylglucosamine synthase-like glycosyltransferase